MNTIPRCQFKELLLCQLAVSGDYPTTINKLCLNDKYPRKSGNKGAISFVLAHLTGE